MTSLDEVADELYGLPPEGFTAARDARVRALRASGRALADAVHTLRRPTTAAWLVDLLVRERRDEVNALLSLGDALREAQRTLSGEALRALGDRRRAVVAAQRAERAARTVQATVTEAEQAARTAHAAADRARTRLDNLRRP